MKAEFFEIGCDALRAGGPAAAALYGTGSGIVRLVQCASASAKVGDLPASSRSVRQGPAEPVRRAPLVPEPQHG